MYFEPTTHQLSTSSRNLVRNLIFLGFIVHAIALINGQIKLNEEHS